MLSLSLPHNWKQNIHCVDYYYFKVEKAKRGKTMAGLPPVPVPVPPVVPPGEGHQGFIQPRLFWHFRSLELEA
jgi:hypothetical protein